jgi:sugar transferase (PEP-CTERM system associated)
VEICILFAAAYLGVNIRLFADHRWSHSVEGFLPSAFAFAMAIVAGMSALGMYEFNFSEGLRRTFLRLMPSLGLGLGILVIVFYFAPDLYFGRGILFLALVIAAVGIFVSRAIFFKMSESKLLASKIIFFGANELAQECSVSIQNRFGQHKYEIAGFIRVADEPTCVPANAIFDTGESLLEIAKRCRAHEIVVAIQNRRGGHLPTKELLQCKLNGINVIDIATLFEREACQIRIDTLQPSWLVFGGGFDQSIVRIFVKRAFDLTASTILLIASLPVLLLTSICIFIEDGSPIFYEQERVGKNGRTFLIRKFRSMRTDAEQTGKPQWAANNDPRTTRVGSFIRKTRIDELPQILNVFNGEMSFVGPRPERPFFVEQHNNKIYFYNARHSIKPGITGWAQVRYAYGASVEDAIQKLQYDLYYVKNNSLFLDILILIDTFRVVLFGAGR